MTDTGIFWLQIACSVAVCVILTKWYVWPSFTALSRNSALVALLFVHVFRYVGMTVLVTSMIDPQLPREFLFNVAYGDLIAAALSLASIVALRSSWRVALPLVWAANTWGFADLVNGVRSLVQLDVPSFDLSTIWYVYTFYAPVVLVSHVLIFWILIKPRPWAK